MIAFLVNVTSDQIWIREQQVDPDKYYPKVQR
jgi:hypothetical protein